MTRGTGLWLAACALTTALGGCATTQGTSQPAASAPSTSSPTSPTSDPPVTPANQDPARFAQQVINRAHEARVNPQLVMAILYNESYKPHDPEVERAWLRFKPNAALGIANMHEATFDQVKRNRSFASRNWQELSDDPDLAIQAAAWYLHDLNTDLPARRAAEYTADELLALGYNSGPANMSAVAQGTTPTPQVQSYLDKLRRNWNQAGGAVQSG